MHTIRLRLFLGSRDLRQSRETKSWEKRTRIEKNAFPYPNISFLSPTLWPGSGSGTATRISPFFTEFTDISHLFGFVHKAYFWTGQDTPAYLEIFSQNHFQTNGFSTIPMLCGSRSNHASSPNSCPIAFRVYWETRPPSLELRKKQCPFWTCSQTSYIVGIGWLLTSAKAHSPFGWTI